MATPKPSATNSPQAFPHRRPRCGVSPRAFRRVGALPLPAPPGSCPCTVRQTHSGWPTAPGPHLFPFRTEKLSPAAPMVLRQRESRSPPFFIQQAPGGDPPGAFPYAPSPGQYGGGGREAGGKVLYRCLKTMCYLCAIIPNEMGINKIESGADRRSEGFLGCAAIQSSIENILQHIQD